uniref:Uncharacterized protein n=1 Tax=Globodera pallida TaxID=36090 RepID=A0A183BKX0_GLOPA
MFKLLRFHLLLLGIITCVVMEPMLVNANSDNGMVEQEELAIIIADRKCRALKAEKCKCGMSKCQEMTGFIAGTCCRDGYMLGCCGKLVYRLLTNARAVLARAFRIWDECGALVVTLTIRGNVAKEWV